MHQFDTRCGTAFPELLGQLRPLVFGDATRTFFRQFGHQFFTKYLGSADPAKKFNERFKSPISAADVTRHLSGVTFLDDDAIMATDSKRHNVAASFLWNQHAIRPLDNSQLDANLRNRGAFDLGTAPD